MRGTYPSWPSPAGPVHPHRGGNGADCRRIGNWVLGEPVARTASGRSRPAGETGRQRLGGETRTAGFAGLVIADSQAQPWSQAGSARIGTDRNAADESIAGNDRNCGELPALGILISLDVSAPALTPSLAYLHELPIDCLKTDRSFVRRVNGGSNESRTPPYWKRSSASATACGHEGAGRRRRGAAPARAVRAPRLRRRPRSSGGKPSPPPT